MRKKILITGGSGFIGNHLRSHLASSWAASPDEIHYTTRRGVDLTGNPGPGVPHVIELRDGNAVQKLFEEVEPDYVVHLACSTTPSRHLDDFSRQLQNTVEPAIQVAKAVSPKTKWVAFFGSCEEYGNGPAPFVEDQALEVISPYGWGKISAFHAVSLICRQRKLHWSWIRPFLSFGPDQNSNLLIPTVIRACLAGQTIPLTPGEQTRDFVYVKDVCRMFEVLLRNSGLIGGETLNLCSGKPRTIRSVCLQIRDLVGSGELDFGALPYRANEAMSFYGSGDKFRTLFGGVELHDWDRSLIDTIASYRKAGTR